MLPEYVPYRQDIAAIQRTTGSRAARRLLGFLADRGSAITTEINRELSIGNISGTVAKIRADLERRGLAITASLPRPLKRNKFGEICHVHVWRLERLA